MPHQTSLPSSQQPQAEQTIPLPATPLRPIRASRDGDNLGRRNAQNCGVVVLYQEKILRLGYRLGEEQGGRKEAQKEQTIVGALHSRRALGPRGGISIGGHGEKKEVVLEFEKKRGLV
mgnify:CR=1 FL=1